MGERISYITGSFARASELGDLSALTTTVKTDAVAAINELKSGLDGLGEPFRVKKWAANLNVTVPSCTQDMANTDIPKLVFRITGQEATDYQVVGMIAYEVFDASGKRMNYIPVCQFTGQNQTELSVRGCVMGPDPKAAASISAWVLLKHR